MRVRRGSCARDSVSAILTPRACTESARKTSSASSPLWGSQGGLMLQAPDWPGAQRLIVLAQIGGERGLRVARVEVNARRGNHAATIPRAGPARRRRPGPRAPPRAALALAPPAPTAPTPRLCAPHDGPSVSRYCSFPSGTKVGPMALSANAGT